VQVQVFLEMPYRNDFLVLANPDAVLAKPDAVLAKPDAVLAKPDAVFPNPDFVLANPEAVFANPDAVLLWIPARVVAACNPARLVVPRLGSTVDFASTAFFAAARLLINDFF
jgi:hypothetical protein